MMKRRTLIKRAGIGALAIVGSGVAAACGAATPPSAAPTATGSTATASAAAQPAATATPLVIRPIKISNTPDNQSPQDFVTLVANSLGIYRKHGVDGQLTDGATASLPPLFLSGGIDVLLHGSALFSQALQGQDVKIVAGIGATGPFTLITRKAINSVADLKGKVFGIQAATGSIYQLGLYHLRKAGLAKDDVKFAVIAGHPNLFAALVAGRVDAALLPWSQAFRSKSEAGLHILDENPYRGFELSGYRFVGVRGKFAQENPEAVTGFVTALIDTTRLLANDESLYMAQLKTLLPNLGADEAADTYKIMKSVGFWAVNGFADPAAINANLEFYRSELVATGATAAPVTNIVETKFAKAALDKLGGPVPSQSDPATWYKK